MSIQSGKVQGEHAVNPSSAEEHRGERNSQKQNQKQQVMMSYQYFNKDPNAESNLVQSAPLVIRVFIKSSWPYRAATCSGVFPSLSTQSISPPVSKTQLYSECTCKSVDIKNQR